MSQADPADPAPAWQRGRRLAVDVGKVRVGVAISDPDGILASPLTTVRRDPDTDAKFPSDLRELADIVAENTVVEVVVGLPVTLAGTEGLAASGVRDYADRLGRHIHPVPIRLIDERMTTVLASRRLAERGVRGRRQRAVVDQAAAVEILQHWLERQRKA